MKKITFFLFAITIASITYAQECVERVVCGEYETTVYLTNGDYYSWGYNEYGQLGNGTTSMQTSPLPTVMSANWQDISQGPRHVLAINNDGTLWAWGSNLYGQLGDGTTVDKLTPVQIGTDTDWVAISTGLNHSLALKSDGTLWGWGSNQAYELENSTIHSFSTPFQLYNDTDWDNIYAGSGKTFLIKTDGTLWVRGRSQNGALGLGQSETTANVLKQVGTDNDWLEIIANRSSETLALKTDNTLWRWGIDAPYCLSCNTTWLPTQLGTDQWKDVARGFAHVAGIKMDGSLWQWGVFWWDNNTEESTPVQLGNDTDWESVSAGIAFSMAIKEDNTLWSWGVNDKGTLGDGTTTSQVNPIQVINCTTMNTVDFDLKEIKFYPNPVKDVLQWTTNLEINTYEVRDILGQKIKFGNTVTNQINLSELKKGVYFIIFHTNEGESINHKILKN